MNFLLKTLNYNVISPVPRKHLAPLSILGTRLRTRPPSPAAASGPQIAHTAHRLAWRAALCGPVPGAWATKPGLWGQAELKLRPAQALGHRPQRHWLSSLHGFLLTRGAGQPQQAWSGVAIVSVRCLLLPSRCSINGSSH